MKRHDANCPHKVMLVRSEIERPDEATSLQHMSFNLHRALEMSQRVHGSSLGTFNLNHYNTLDERLRLNYFLKNQRLIRCFHVPPT